MTCIGRHTIHLAIIAAAVSGATGTRAATLTTAPYGTTQDGRPVNLYTMTTTRGLSVQFISYGGRLTRILAPDRRGHAADILLGFPTLADYEAKGGGHAFYFGALVGRYANRIAHGRFTLEGHEYTLPINNPPNSLHGGTKGFDTLLWNVEPVTTSGQAVSARLSLTSPDGDQGFPGTLHVTVTYALSDDNALSLQYEA
ncbi:MAG TPA: galactose-1-epimerase, partial [Rhodopila sp.]|nr:galactose-1-epimerase [Rhodopila sp.]